MVSQFVIRAALYSMSFLPILYLAPEAAHHQELWVVSHLLYALDDIGTLPGYDQRSFTYLSSWPRLIVEGDIGQVRQNLPNFYGELFRPRLEEDLRNTLDDEVDARGEGRQGTHIQHTQALACAGNTGGPRNSAHLSQ